MTNDENRAQVCDQSGSGDVFPCADSQRVDLVAKLEHERFDVGEARDDRDAGYRQGWNDRSASLLRETVVAPGSELRAQLRQVNDQITNLYWTFTRTRRGKPPAVFAPQLYVKRRRLHELLAILQRGPALELEDVLGGEA